MKLSVFGCRNVILIILSFVLPLGQYLQESRPREGEEGVNIRRDQKGRHRQEGEASPRRQGSLQGGGQSHEEGHAGNAEERATCQRW